MTMQSSRFLAIAIGITAVAALPALVAGAETPAPSPSASPTATASASPSASPTASATTTTSNLVDLEVGAYIDPDGDLGGPYDLEEVGWTFSAEIDGGAVLSSGGREFWNFTLTIFGDTAQVRITQSPMQGHVLVRAGCDRLPVVIDGWTAVFQVRAPDKGRFFYSCSFINVPEAVLNPTLTPARSAAASPPGLPATTTVSPDAANPTLPASSTVARRAPAGSTSLGFVMLTLVIATNAVLGVTVWRSPRGHR
jgi:hypothetical protein